MSTDVKDLVSYESDDGDGDGVKRFWAIPGKRIETSLLIARLAQGKPGDRVSDTDLTTLCGLDTRPGEAGYALLYSAQQHCEKNGVVWQRRKGEGFLECLPYKGRIEKVQKFQRRIHTASRKALTLLKNEDLSALSERERNRHLALTANFETLSSLTSGWTTRRIEQEPQAHLKRLNQYKDGHDSLKALGLLPASDPAPAG